MNRPFSSLKKIFFLIAQINTIFKPDQQIALEQLLMLKIKCVLCLSLGKVKKKKCWLAKKGRNNFKANPYNAGKTLLDPKRYVNLKVEQEDLEQHKPSSLTDINYNIPLAELEG